MKKRTQVLDIKKIFKPVTRDIYDVINLYNDQTQKLIEVLTLLDSLMKHGYVSSDWEDKISSLLDRYSVSDEASLKEVSDGKD